MHSSYNRLHHSLGLPYTSVAVVFALLLGGVVGVVEYLVPWQTEVPVSAPTHYTVLASLYIFCTLCISVHIYDVYTVYSRKFWREEC